MDSARRLPSTQGVRCILLPPLPFFLLFGMNCLPAWCTTSVFVPIILSHLLLPHSPPLPCRLILVARGLQAGLPDWSPGALPALESLMLRFSQQSGATLPAGWGTRPGVLPVLQQLKLEMAIEGQLPPEWASGFRCLERLIIAGPPPVPSTATPEGGAAATPPAVVVARLLPPEWAGATIGGFPKLELLELRRLGLEGSLPRSWLGEGGFPALAHL